VVVHVSRRKADRRVRIAPASSRPSFPFGSTHCAFAATAHARSRNAASGGGVIVPGHRLLLSRFIGERLDRTLEFDQVAVRVAEVQGRSLALGAEVHPCGATWRNAVPGEVTDDLRFVERIDPQTEMVDIVPFRLRPRPSGPAERAVQGDQIHE